MPVKIYLRLWLLIMAMPATAGVLQDMDDYLERSGFSKNYTKPSVFKSQMAGHFVGGSLVARSASRNYKLADISLPKISAGCGGIDMHMGSFSHISTDQFSNLGKVILTQATPVALDLALSELSPNLKDIKDHMVQVMNTVNMASINSCEMAQGIVGALAPKTQYASEHICKTIATDNGILSDYVSSRHGCEINSSDYDNTIKTAKAKKLDDVLVDRKNIAWHTIKRNHFYMNDSDELSYMLMSLTGTVIIDSKQSASPIIYPSLANNAKFVEALLHGGDIKLYQCIDNEDCLNLSHKSIKVPAIKALSYKVRFKIRSLLEKARDPKQGLTDEDKAFLEATHFPMYKFINVEAATTTNNVNTQLESYADIIAVEILSKYLTDNIALIRASALKLKADSTTFKVFDDNAMRANRYLAGLKTSAYDKLVKLESIIERTEFLEKALSNKLGAHLSNNHKL